MAASIDSLINSIFSLYNRSGNAATVTEQRYVTSKKMMEIPVNKDTFLLPTFAFEEFDRHRSKVQESDAIVTRLLSNGVVVCNKTLEPNIKSVLASRYCDLKVIKVPNTEIYYYATHGAIFDSELNPVMIASWKVKKNPLLDTGYEFIRPYLWLSRSVLISQNDNMQRFLAKKFLACCLDVCIWQNSTISSFSSTRRRVAYTVKAEIDDCPFRIVEAKAPSIATTNADLINTAIEHLEEMNL